MAIIKPTLNLVASEYTPEILNVTRASGATRVNAVGLVERVGDGTLRYDYDPTTLAGKGWLIEEARTNLCLQSENHGTSPWGPFTMTMTENDTTHLSPAGLTTGVTKCAAASTTSTSFSDLQSIATITADTVNVVRCWFKAGTVTHAALVMDGSSANGCAANFDLSAGTISRSAADEGTGTAISSSITAYPNGWYLCELIGQAGSGETSLRVGHYPCDATSTKAANISLTAGDEYYAYGYTCENNVSVGTSYIPTTTATVTRAVDIMTVNLSDIDFNDGGEGTAYLHAEYPDVSGMGNGSPFALDDGTTADKISMYGPDATNQVHVGGAEQFGGTAGTLSDATPYRYALTWATNNFNYARDGSLFQSADTSGNVPTSLTTIRFGNTPGHIQLKKQHVVHFALFPARLIDADLQTITTG